MTTTRVELEVRDNGLSFTLDNAFKGVLDNTTYVLSSGFTDISSYVYSVSVGRGKNRELDKFSAGNMTVELRNNTRAFDPTYASSPFYGNILPRRRMRVFVNDVQQFQGWINDWSYSYDVSGESLVSVSLSDAFTVLSNQELNNVAVVEQATGARINTVLNSAGWAVSDRVVDAGNSVVAAGTASGNVLSYLQQVEASEQGSLFVDRLGDVVFQARSSQPSGGSAVVFADDGSGIPFTGANISYSSDLLFNQSYVTYPGGTAVANANNVAPFTVRTNEVLNPSFEVDLANWYAFGVTTMTRQAGGYSGSWSARALTPSAGEGSIGIYSVGSLQSNATYTFSAYVKPSVTFNVSLYPAFSTSGTAPTPLIQSCPAGVWTRLSKTVTTTISSSYNFNISLYDAGFNIPIGTYVDIDAVMVEQVSTVGTYFDGSTPDTVVWDYSWSGTANNSFSTALTTDQTFIDSQRTYGVIAHTTDTLLASSYAATDFANYFANAYAQPKYRFSDVSVSLNDPLTDVSKMLNLEIGSLAQVKFTPNKTGTQISQLANVTKLEHRIGIDRHDMIVGVTPIDFVGLILDSSAFGILNTNRLAF